MKILVTGARGFIGTPLCQALTKQGHTVLQWDLPDQDITQGAEVYGSAVMAWMHGRNPQLDAVVHLAAVASPLLCDRDPALAYQVNVRGTHNLLKLAVGAKVKRFILASSAHAYGISPLYLPTDERAPQSVFDTYTTTKLISERLCDLFWENYGLSYASIRLFNGYGPGQLLGYFIPDKLAQDKAQLKAEAEGYKAISVKTDEYIEHFVSLGAKEREWFRAQFVGFDTAAKTAGVIEEKGSDKENDKTEADQFLAAVDGVLKEEFRGDIKKYSEAFTIAQTKHPALAQAYADRLVS